MKTAITFLVNSFSLQMRILVGSNPTKKIMSCHYPGVVELVDTRDLKSLGSDTVPVRVRSPGPQML